MIGYVPPSGHPAKTRHDRRALALYAMASLAFLLKLWLIATTFGTNDMLTFDLMAQKLEAKGVKALYEEGTEVKVDDRSVVSEMNHPPFVLTLLRLWSGMRSVTGVSLGVWMRLTCALADLMAFLLVWSLMGMQGERWLALMILAMAPTAIMISGFHGNSDPIMIAFVVLAVYFLEKRDSPWMAGAAFALACSVKVWPLVLTPIFLFSAGTLVRRFNFCLSALATAMLASMPWIAAAPALIFHNVFDYGSLPGWWGFTYLDIDSYSAAKSVVFAVVLAAEVFMYKRVPSLLAQCGIVTSLFLFFTPGFGPQYLAWVVPWTAAAGWWSAGLYHLLSGFFVFNMYTAWSLHFPWYFANAHKYSIPQWVLRSGLLAWVCLLILAFETYRRNRREPVAADRDRAPLQ